MASKKHKTLAFGSTFALFILATLAGLIWRFTPLHHRFTIQNLTQHGHALQTHAWAPFAVMGIYMAGGLILFFHAVLLWTTVFIFDPWHAFFYCELGTMSSAITMYGLGRIVRPEFVEQIAGSYLDKVSKALARKGKLTLMILHWFPICPFSILNFISGATHIRFGDFLVGTFVGCTPGLIILVVFSHQILQILHSHHWLNVVPVMIGIGILIAGGRYTRSHLLPKRARK
jgi:phospholipase D1/2